MKTIFSYGHIKLIQNKISSILYFNNLIRNKEGYLLPKNLYKLLRSHDIFNSFNVIYQKVQQRFNLTLSVPLVSKYENPKVLFTVPNGCFTTCFLKWYVSILALVRLSTSRANSCNGLSAIVRPFIHSTFSLYVATGIGLYVPILLTVLP